MHNAQCVQSGNAASAGYPVPCPSERGHDVTPYGAPIATVRITLLKCNLTIATGHRGAQMCYMQPLLLVLHAVELSPAPRRPQIYHPL